jgi:hypothetical protein
VCLRERTVLLLKFGEQAHVLDGDDGLVGERPNQVDLFLGERPLLPPGDGDRAYGTLLTEHRHGEDIPEAELPRQLAGRGRSVLRQGIHDVDDHAVADCPPRHGRVVGGRRKDPVQGLEGFRGLVVMGHHVNALTVEPVGDAE